MRYERSGHDPRGRGVFRIVPSAVAGKGNATPQLVETGKPLPGLQYPD